MKIDHINLIWQLNDLRATQKLKQTKEKSHVKLIFNYLIISHILRVD